MTGSVKTSPHLSKDRLVVIIVDFLPVLIDKLVNSNSAPSLSDDIYPNSSRITKSYFSSFDWNDLKLFVERNSFSCVINNGTVAKKTLYPLKQAFIPNPMAIWVFPVPQLPDKI